MSDDLVKRLKASFPGHEWAKVPGFDTYFISNHGLLYSLPRARTSGGIKEPYKAAGYWRVGLWKDGRKKNAQLNRLVLTAFTRAPVNGEQAAHLNGDPNDNRLENLAWVSPAKNTNHKNAHGTMLRGSRMYNSKLTEVDVATLRRRYANGESPSMLAAEYGISRGCCQNIIYGRSWKHVA